MTKLLSPDPEKRPTAKEALAHPFLSQKDPTVAVSKPPRLALQIVSLHVSRESQNQQLCPSRNHARIDAWATLVDYVVEIVEVFDLKIEAAFRAMNYFDRFFSLYPGSVSFNPDTD